MCPLFRIELQNRGFTVKDCEEKYRGERATNICNRGRTGKGVQYHLMTSPW
ncbi:poly-gamma-glutamate hydrolase family protein [Desulfosporosinus acididurans]|uniref:poly-gamma-glutamate hydrolase family protein n=1 Tax=Desulfosporosinus acididurans TaxID=476652 RepID=UPI001FA6A9CD|nr:poly-gamma-glutamate hydrolase family protein [Desulfosporosinus acididurans]